MATRSLNKVQLIGNLTRDPELRYTPQGTAVCTFGLATNRAWTTEGGEKREETEFHRIVAWNKLAELCSQLLFKGRRIFVEGRLQTRTWAGQDGSQRQTTEIVIEDMIILDSRRTPGEEPVEVGSLPVAPKKGEGAGTVSEEGAAAVVSEAPQPPTDSPKEEPPKTSPPPADKKKKSGAKTKEAKTEEGSQDEVKPEDIPF